MRTSALLSLLSLSLVAACAEDDGAGPDGGSNGAHETVRSALARDTSPDVDPAAVEAVAAGNQALTLELYRETATDGANYLVSAWSIQQAFALTYAGAVGDTATQMREVLHFDGEPAVFDAAMNSLDLALTSRQLPAGEEEGEGAVELAVANAFWGQTGYPWASTYLDRIAVAYGAGVEAVDFETDAEGARQTINAWVEDRTRDRIVDLLPEGSIDSGTAAVLTNAVYFKAPWAETFNPDTTDEAGTFTRLDGSTVEVPLMSQLASHTFASDDGWVAAEMGFRGDELAMLFIVPTPGTFEAFDATFDAARLSTVIDALQPAQVRVTLPRFTFETEFTLSDALKTLGMEIPFSSEADFSGMLPGGGLFISEAYHKTFIAVDEGGAEAAAATAVVVGETSAPVEEGVLDASTPFYFAIRDRQTGIVLFFGRVLDPTAE